MKFGLSRTRRLLDGVGSPDDRLKIIHIAGSNGKGSTAAYISHILKAANKRVGTFTSPPVFCYEEQFLIDCVPASGEKIDKYLKAVADVQVDDKPTRFELETAAALLLFAEEGCEYAVIECGLGGRDDATNAIRKKELAVITSVSLEHTQYLGSTVKGICAVKSGIIKDCAVIVNALQTAEGRSFFEGLGARFASDGTELISQDLRGQSFAYGGHKYRISAFGKAQRYNAATAIEVALFLGIGYDDVVAGLADTRLYGRAQIIERTVNGRNVTFILDGAHNPAAMRQVAEAIDLAGEGGGAELVFGCLSDKDVGGVAEILAPHIRRATVFSPDNPRAMPVSEIAEAFKKYTSVDIARSVEDALSQTRLGCVAVCGSFSFIKEAYEWIKKQQ